MMLRNRRWSDDPMNLIRLRPAKEGWKWFEALLLQGCFFSLGGVKMEVLKINGVEKEFTTGKLPSTVAELIERLDIKAAIAVAEIDDQIVERKDFAEAKIRSGQNIELVRFIGGG